MPIKAKCLRDIYTHLATPGNYAVDTARSGRHITWDEAGDGLAITDDDGALVGYHIGKYAAGGIVLTSDAEQEAARDKAAVIALALDVDGLCRVHGITIRSYKDNPLIFARKGTQFVIRPKHKANMVIVELGNGETVGSDDVFADTFEI